MEMKSTVNFIEDLYLRKRFCVWAAIKFLKKSASNNQNCGNWESASTNFQAVTLGYFRVILSVFLWSMLELE